MASTHETPERGGAPALGGTAYDPLNMEVQHARVPLGAGTRIGSDGYFKPESKGSVCRQVVAGPRNHSCRFTGRVTDRRHFGRGQAVPSRCPTCGSLLQRSEPVKMSCVSRS